MFSILKAFIAGGILCVICQLLIDFTNLTTPKILVGFVIAGVILGALGIYGPFMEFAGAGASVPLSGFGNLLCQGVKKAVDEKGALGILTGALSESSAGITTAVISALLISFIFDPGDKNK